MSLKLGNTDINKLYLGSTEIKKAYLGSTLVFDKTVVASGIYDNASVVYSLRRPDMATKWTNAVLKVRRSSDDATAFVFFDGSAVDDTISLSSLISTTSNTTPDATTLTTWVGANDAYVEQWIGISPNNTIGGGKTGSQTTTTKQPQFISSGVIITDGGLPAILNNRTNKTELVASANTDLDDGKVFTSLIVASSGNGDVLGGILSTSKTTNRYSISVDTRTQARIAIITTSGTNGVTSYLARQTTTDQRLLSTITDSSTKDVTSYYNAVFQETNSYTGSHTNTEFAIGAYDLNNYLSGYIQEIIIMPSDVTSDLTTLHADINSYYSIYV